MSKITIMAGDYAQETIFDNPKALKLKTSFGALILTIEKGDVSGFIPAPDKTLDLKKELQSVELQTEESVRSLSKTMGSRA